jgi:hypothetical protein
MSALAVVVVGAAVVYFLAGDSPDRRSSGQITAPLGERGKPWETSYERRLVCESCAGELLVEHPDADQHRRSGPRPPALTPQLSTASHGLPLSRGQRLGADDRRYRAAVQ